MKKFLGAVFLLIISVSLARASAQTTGANFLDIPVGALPASMGSAYSAMASDVYAPIWNPAGLGYLESTQAAGQHLSYLDSIHYEYLGVAHPLHLGKAFGFGMQYLGTGDITQTDNSGNSVGEFSSYYSAYSFAYGQKISPNLAFGGTAKIIHAKLADVSATAYGADLGVMGQLREHLKGAATISNIGSDLKFLSEGDPLPLTGRLGAAYEPSQAWTFSSDLAYRRTGLASFHMGGRWKPVSVLGISMGYKTENLKELSPLAGLTMGLSLNLWSSELGYAWVPYGELGNTHYISFLMRFGEAERAKRNLIYLPGVKSHDAKQKGTADDSDVQQLMQLFDDSEKNHVAQSPKPTGEALEAH